MTPTEEIFGLFPQLAARVTNLRTIIQNPEVPITKADKLAWSEDVKSTLNDFLTLLDKTATIVRALPTQE